MINGDNAGSFTACASSLHYLVFILINFCNRHQLTMTFKRRRNDIRMTFKTNMAVLPFMFICLLSLSVNCEVQNENGSNNVQTYDSEILAVLNYLNSSSFQVYKYKEATLLHAHIKADITELALDINVDCVNYPDVPCSAKVLTCHAFVQKTPEGSSRVLNDVNCKLKPEIIVEEPSFDTPTSSSAAVINETKFVALSNEAVSSEVNEPFVAIRKDSVPCLGCPFDLHTNVEGVDELIDLALEHVGSERTNKQALVKVLRVQQQVISGVKYTLIAELGATVCPKDTVATNECPLDPNSETTICEITYLQKPWISKAKHIISNNCTVSQEYVKTDDKKPDISNEIEGGKPTQPSVNFDRIAESGTFELSSSRLSDLESQIVVDLEESPQQNKNTPKPQTQVVSSTVIPQPQLSDLESQIVVNLGDSKQDDVVKSESKVEAVPSTVVTQTQVEPKIEDNGKSGVVTREGVTLSPEEQEIKEPTVVPECGESRPKREESLETTVQFQVEVTTLPGDEVTTVPKREEKSSESSESSESQQKQKKQSSEEDSSEEKYRGKRAIPQLEKITPEEKGLVKNLADFAAAALDNIDDDNHKRVVLQILGAKKMVGDDGVYYHLILRMGVSRCLEDRPPNPYENCRDKLFENYTKICKVQVYVNDDFSTPKVVKSQCQNIKKDQDDSNRTNYSRFRRQLAGGQTEIDKNSDKVKELLDQGLTLLNAGWDKDHKHKPVEILSATSQVVAGVQYRIFIKLAESDCLKNGAERLEDCNVGEGTPAKECEVKVWERVWLKSRQYTIKCEGDEKPYKFQTGLNKAKRSLRVRRALKRVPGGEFEVPHDDEFVTKYLEASLTQLDTQSSHDNKLKLGQILSATKQIVAGHIYRIKAEVVTSDCTKQSKTKRHKCGTLSGAQPKTCTFKIFEALWIPDSRTIDIDCDQARTRRDLKYSMDSGDSGFVGKDDAKLHFDLFTAFVKKYKKRYSKKEYKRRFEVFRRNLFRIRVLNTYEQGTAKYGVTRFADMTPEEFSKSLGLRPDLRDENAPPLAQATIPDVELPTEFDWRSKGAVTEVKNQEQCGSCWAFSVTGNVEGQYAIKHGKLLEFSEQELVDCDTEDQGCNGGLMDTAYREIEKLGGLETEQDYPYDAEDEKCHFNRTLARVQLSGALNISHNETDMAKWLVANGPISIAINANAMQFYFGGISHPFKFLCNPNNLDHGVLVVGYGVHTYPLFNRTMPYWIIKNSWGTSWGEQGYYRVYRGDGTCGLNQTPSSAIVV